jgi:hypothetical protein
MILISIFLVLSGLGQERDSIPQIGLISGNSVISQPLNQPRSLRIFLDNDFLNFRGAGTDRYYTNGVRIDYFFTKKRKAITKPFK